MSRLPYLELKLNTWYTAGAHPALGLRPNGRYKAQRVSTGLRADQLQEAAAFSMAYGQFIRENWGPDRYGEARKIHESAAEIYFRPYRHRKIDDQERQAEEFHDMCFPSRAAELAELRKNTEAAIKLVEAEAVIESLKKELGKAVAGADIPLRKVADEYYEWGCLKGGKGGRPWSYHHERKRKAQLDWWCERITKLSEITIASVEEQQRQLTKTVKGKTANHYLETISALCQFAVDRKYFIRSPLENLTRLHDDSDEEKWRPLSMDELSALLENCKEERRIVYELAVCSGLRRGELEQLTVADFDEERSGILVPSAVAKNRKKSFQPLPAWLVEKLAGEVKGKLPTAQLVYMDYDPHEGFVRDWGKTGLPRVVGGTVACFHSLRKTFLTLADQSGASAKTSQSLARHATADMTLRRYIGVVDASVREAVEAVGAKVRA